MAVPLFLFAAGVVPFLNPIHTDPLPGFYSEWLAAALGLAIAAAALVRSARSRTLPVPYLALLPAMLIGAALAQLASGHAAHPDAALMYIHYLLLAILLAIAGRCFAGSSAGPGHLPWLPAGFAAGASVQAAVILLQRGGVPWAWLHSPWVTGTWTGGALGQRNHLVDYLWLGIASIGYLTARGTLKIPFATGLVIAIAAASVMAGSRSAFLYPIALAVLAILAARRDRSRHRWRAVAALLALTIPAMLAVDRMVVPSTAEGRRDATATERLAARELDPVRSGLLQVAWQAMRERPLAGYGVGSAQAVTFDHADTWPPQASPVVAEHFHNLFAQWFVEFGAPVALLAIGVLAWWGLGAVRSASGPEPWWLLMVLAIVGLHSLLEYPLWFAYFLVPAAIAGGALGSGGTNLPVGRRHRVFAWLVLLADVVILGGLWYDYKRLERAAAATRPGSPPVMVEYGIDEALSLSHNSLLAPQAIVAAAAAMGVSRQGAEDKWRICERALRVSRGADVTAKCGAIGILANNRTASHLWSRSAYVYGEHRTRAALTQQGWGIEGENELFLHK